MLAALARGAVDRVPVMEMAIDWEVMRGLGFSSYLDMIDGLDLDAVSVNQALYLLGWRRWIVPHLTYYTDEWGVKTRLAGELLPVPVGHPVPTLAALDRYTPPRPERSPLLKAIRFVRRRVRNRAIMLLSRNDFAASWFLCGMDTLLMSYIEEPELADRLGEMVSSYYTKLFGLVVREGVDVVVLTDDYAYKSGTLMSHDHFKRFVLPWLSKGVQAVHDAGGLCIKHTDGNISEIMDLIAETGVDGVGPLEPGVGMDLRRVQRDWGHRVAIVGNIDVDMLCRDTPASVAKTTGELVKALAPGRGHILSSGNTITSAVKPENFRAMIDAGRRASAGS